MHTDGDVRPAVPPASTAFLGSVLFTRFVSGTRVVPRGQRKTVGGVDFAGFGASANAYPHDYLTAACAVGLSAAELDEFLLRLDKAIRKTKGNDKLAKNEGVNDVVMAKVPGKVAAELDGDGETGYASGRLQDGKEGGRGLKSVDGDANGAGAIAKSITGERRANGKTGEAMVDLCREPSVRPQDTSAPRCKHGNGSTIHTPSLNGNGITPTQATMETPEEEDWDGVD